MTLKELMDINIIYPDRKIYDSAKDRWDHIAKPIDGLGDLEKIICRICAIQGKVLPDISKKALIIMCADNGVVCENITQTGQGVTASVAHLMAERQSSVCIMTKDYPLDIFPVDIGIASDETINGIINRKVAMGTGNILREPAMSSEQCLKAVNTGIDIVRDCSEKGYGLIATGEMGIGNTTTSTALCCALTGQKPESITGRGAGLSDEGLRRKTQVICEALIRHGLAENECPDKEYAFNALSKVGGLDIAGLAGVFIGGAIYHIPVLIDGFISAVAAYCAQMMVPGSVAYMIASHTGKEKGTGVVLNRLGLKAVIDADLSLGEGTGAVLLLPMLDMSMALYREGIVFSDTDIEEYKRYK